MPITPALLSKGGCVSVLTQSQALAGYAVLVFSCLVASNPLAAACEELSEAAHLFFLTVWAFNDVGWWVGFTTVSPGAEQSSL